MYSPRKIFGVASDLGQGKAEGSGGQRPGQPETVVAVAACGSILITAGPNPRAERAFCNRQMLSPTHRRGAPMAVRIAVLYPFTKVSVHAVEAPRIGFEGF